MPHEGLLRKLELYNFDTRWFVSYLTGHHQQVVTQSQCGSRTLSASLSNPIGTYQGSALGPLLYSIYANDMPLYADDACIVQYADDTQVLVSGRPGDTDPVYMSQSSTTEKFVQQTSAKNPITGPVYMSKAPRSTEYFDRGVSEKFV